MRVGEERNIKKLIAARDEYGLSLTNDWEYLFVTNEQIVGLANALISTATARGHGHLLNTSSKEK